MSSKNDTFKEHIRELTIINDYERKNSLKLKQTSSEEADELKRELHKMKFKCSILSDEKESLQQELDSFQKWTEVLNSRFVQPYLPCKIVSQGEPRLYPSRVNLHRIFVV